MRAWVRRVALLVGAVVVVLVAAVGGLLVALQFPAGQRWTAELASRLLSAPGKAIAVDRIELALPDRLILHGVALGDAGGTYLSVDRLTVAVVPLALVEGRFALRDVAVGTAALRRLPKSEGGGALPPVSIGHLGIGRLELAKPLLGEPVALTVSGEGLAASDEGIEGRLAVQRLDGPGALHLAIDYDEARAVLDASARIEEPSGLLLERVLGRRLPLSATLAGKGPLAGWHGTLRADAGTDAHLALDLAIAAKGAGHTVSATGTIAAQPLLPPRFAPLLGPEARLAAALEIGEDRRLALDTLTLAAAAGRIAAQGSLDRASGALAAKITADAPDLAALAAPLGLPLGGAGSLEADLSGTLERPSATLRLAATDAAYGGSRAGHLAGTVRLSLDDDLTTADPRFTLDGHGEVAGIALAGAPLPPSLADRLDWDLELTGNRSATRLELRRLALADGGARLETNASLAAGIVTGRTALALPDPALLAGLLGGRLAGAAQLTAEFRAALAGMTATVWLGGDLDRIDSPEAAVKALLGPRVDIAATVQRASSGAIDITGLELAGAKAQLSGEGHLAADLGSITARLRAAVPDISAVAPASGGATLQLRLDGPWSALAASGHLEASKLALGGSRLDVLAADFAIPDLVRRAGHVDATFRGPGGLSGAAHGDADLADGRVALSALRLEAAGASLTGNVSIGLDGTGATGRLKGSVPNLAPFSTLAGTTLRGAVEVAAALDPKAGQSLDLRLSGRDLGWAANSLGTARVSAQLANLRDRPRGRAEITLAAGAAAGLALKEARLTLSSTAAGRFRFAVAMEGAAPAPLQATASGTASWERGAATLRLERLAGRYEKAAFTLRRPLTVGRDSRRMFFDGLDLAIGKGNVSGSGSLAGTSLALRLRAARLPLGLAARLAGYSEVTGRIGLDLTVDGTMARPHGLVVMTGDALRFAAASRPDLPALAMSARAEWQAGRVELRGRVDAPHGAAIGFSGSLPLELRHPIALAVPSAGRLAFTLEGDGDLAQIADLLPLGEDRLAGRYVLDAGVSGTVGAPVARGRISITGGRYESMAAGTVLTNLELTLVGDGQRFVLRNLSASDGGAGRLTGAGAVDLGAAGSPRLSLRLGIQHFRAVRRDDAQATLGGSVELAGTLAAPRLDATLTVEEAEIAVPDRLPASVPKLSVVRVGNRPGQRPAAERPTSPVVAVALALRVTAPGRIFVRGRGLDSEWRGAVTVGGTSAAPVVTGSLQVVRGTFSLLGKDFALARGTLTFAGGTPPDPLLDILAEANSGGIVAQVRVAGTAGAPKISLASQPELPQDEVLARVLFGTGVGQITPLQGVQLAQAAAALAGGAPDVLGKIRQGLGLDRLSIGSGAGPSTLSAAGAAPGTASSSPAQSQGGFGSSTLSAGKYVAPGVYLGLEQSFAGGGSAVRVETDLAPHLSVGAEAGSQGNNSVGLNFKMDY